MVLRVVGGIQQWLVAESEECPRRCVCVRESEEFNKRFQFLCHKKKNFSQKKKKNFRATIRIEFCSHASVLSDSANSKLIRNIIFVSRASEAASRPL